MVLKVPGFLMCLYRPAENIHYMNGKERLS